MWAMMPMLRTFVRSVSTSRAMVVTPPLAWWAVLGKESVGRTVGPSPPVVREGLVRLGHLVRVLAALDRGTKSVAGVQQFVHQPVDHRLLTALPGEGDQPTQPERGGPDRPHLDRHLVGGTTDAAALDLDRRLDVVQRALEGDHGVGAGLVPATFHGAV